MDGRHPPKSVPNADADLVLAKLLEDAAFVAAFKLGAHQDQGGVSRMRRLCDLHGYN